MSADSLRLRAVADAPGWRLRGGAFGSCLFYGRELPDGTLLRAKIRGDDHGAPAATHFHVTMATNRVLSDATLRTANAGGLERAISESLSHAPEYLVAWCGVSVGAPVRRSRGRPKAWTNEALSALVQVVLERQVAGERPDDLTEVPPWRLAPRTVRGLLALAEAKQLVEIDRTVGRRNQYRQPNRAGF